MRFPGLSRDGVEPPILLAWIVAAGGLLGFLQMAQLARGSSPHELDTAILLSLREPGNPAQPIGPAWVAEAVRDVTALGSVSVLVFITTAAILYFLLSRRAGMALFVFVSVAGGQVISSLLKLGVDRPRPDLTAHLAEVFTPSFPSGHAMLSAVTYLTLGVIMATTQPTRRLKAFVLFVAILATALVGASRVYLGVHWPSDVLAGWCAGATWAMLCWLGAQWLPRRQKRLASDNQR